MLKFNPTAGQDFNKKFEGVTTSEAFAKKFETFVRPKERLEPTANENTSNPSKRQKISSIEHAVLLPATRRITPKSDEENSFNEQEMDEKIQHHFKGTSTLANTKTTF